MKTARREKRRGRPPGSGAIKFIVPAVQEFDVIERLLHFGEEQPSHECVKLFRQWRGLVEHRDDCERRIKQKHNTATKWTRRRLASLRKEVGEAWQRLGQSLELMNAEQRSLALAAMARAEQPQSVFPWQEAVTRLLKARMARQ